MGKLLFTALIKNTPGEGVLKEYMILNIRFTGL
jgi:hypothetical protein